MPRKGGASGAQERADQRFNEAAAPMPRKGTPRHIGIAWNVSGFNEAAAPMPRKARSGSAGSAAWRPSFNEAAAPMPRSRSFNEAAAPMPRKEAVQELAGKLEALASMRPRLLCRGKLDDVAGRGGEPGCFNEAAAPMPRKVTEVSVCAAVRV